MDPRAEAESAPAQKRAGTAAPIAPGSLGTGWDRVLTTPRGTRRARMSLSVALALLALLASVAAWQGFLHSAVAVRLGSMNEIVFAGGKNLDSADSPIAVPQLYVMHPDGSGLRRLTNPSNGGYFAPVWSPDGTRIAAYTLPSGGDIIARLAVMNADGSHVRVISNDALSLGASDPSSPDSFLSVSGLISWSPDGSQLVAEMGIGLYLLVNADGTHPRIFNALLPVWSPDGRYLASYASSPNNPASQQSASGFTIALLDTQTSQTHLLSGLPELTGGALAWSPDGRYLAVSALVESDFQFQHTEAVLLVRPDGTFHNLVAKWTDEQVQQLVWSPDSQKLAVVMQSLDNAQQGNGGPASGFGLLVLDADGSHSHQVGFNDGGQPSWSPDGKHLIYANRDDTSLQVADTSVLGGAAPRALPAALDFLFAPCWSPLAAI